MIKSNKPLNVVFIGHVDHGKSTLISRLAISTSDVYRNKYNTLINQKSSLDLDNLEICHLIDQFSEEQKDAMTIDTTEVQIKHQGRHFNLIDAPGHFELLKNMISGASRADAAVLVIDCLEGLKSQTYKHLEIIDFLGCSQLIVAINKIDLLEFTEKLFNDISSVLNNFLKNSCPLSIKVIPISAKNNLGITSPNHSFSWYKGSDLLSTLMALSDRISPEAESHLIFPIQDIFDLSGVRWLTGKIVSGTIKKGQNVILMPKKQLSSVSKIVRFPTQIEEAFTNESISVLLKDDPGIFEEGLIVSDSIHTLKYSKDISGKFIWLDNEPLKLNETIIFRSTSQKVQGKIKRIRNNKTNNLLTYGDFGDIDIALENPIAMENSAPLHSEMNRFIIERNGKIVSGGISG